MPQIFQSNQFNSKSNSNPHSQDSQVQHLRPNILAGNPLAPIVVSLDSDKLQAKLDESDMANNERDENNNSVDNVNPQSSSQIHYNDHAIIPQREAFLRRFLASKLNQNKQFQSDIPLHIGHLSRPPKGPQIEAHLVALQPPAQPFRAVELFPPNANSNLNSNQQQTLGQSFSVAVPESLRPHRGDESRLWQQPRPTIASQAGASGFSALPSETTTNFFPIPFNTDDGFGSTSADDERNNELDRTQRNRRRRRRRKRSLTDQISKLTPTSKQSSLSSRLDYVGRQLDLSGRASAAHFLPEKTAQIGQQLQQTKEAGLESAPKSAQTFGMPALNIHSLRRRRRRKRYVGGLVGILAENLRAKAL